MKCGIRPMVPVIAAAVLVVSGATAQTRHPDTSDTSTSTMPGMQGMQNMRGMHGNSQPTSGMQPMMGQMMEQMKADDARLKDLLAKMNAATGSDKVDAIAAVVNEMATQQMAMHQHMATMMGHMEGMGGMPGMQEDHPMPMGSGAAMKGNAGMAGHNMPGMSNGATASSSSLSVEGVTSPNPPVVGKNTFTFTVQDANGQPVASANPQVSVAMANMDMGTSHPTVEGLGGGRYRTTVAFTMAGPWRVTVTAAPSGVSPVSKSLLFNVGRSAGGK